jgi:hypothetical protein
MKVKNNKKTGFPISSQVPSTTQPPFHFLAANCVRRILSGNHYAQIRVRGKLIWKSLKTDRISVAKSRLMSAAFLASAFQTTGVIHCLSAGTITVAENVPQAVDRLFLLRE